MNFWQSALRFGQAPRATCSTSVCKPQQTKACGSIDLDYGGFRFSGSGFVVFTRPGGYYRFGEKLHCYISYVCPSLSSGNMGVIKALLLQRKRNVNNYFDFDLYIPLTQIQSNKNHCTLCTSNSMIPFRNTKTSHADDCLERNTVHATNAEVHGRSSRSHLVSALCRLLHRAPWINRT